MAWEGDRGPMVNEIAIRYLEPLECSPTLTRYTDYLHATVAVVTAWRDFWNKFAAVLKSVAFRGSWMVPLLQGKLSDQCNTPRLGSVLYQKWRCRW